MNAPTSSTVPNKSLPVHPDVEAEIRKLAEETIPKRPAQLENEVERIRSSITRLTSSSIDGLQELTSELQELQRFLNSEVQRSRLRSMAHWPESTSSSTPLRLGKAVRRRQHLQPAPAPSVPVPAANIEAA